MNFLELGLSPVITDTLKKKGYKTPTDIQLQAIPEILNGNDVIGSAQTGTGKTAAFTLPIIQCLSEQHIPGESTIRALIITPTRELASQCVMFLRDYGKSFHLKFASIYGGVPIEPQIKKIENGIDILIATPGRLIDISNRGLLNLTNLDFFVLDEADRLLHLGFHDEINKILTLLPKERQNLLFSATYSNDIRDLAQTLLHNPVEISINPEIKTAVAVEQMLYTLDKRKKSPFLIKLLKDNDWKQVLIFTKTKNEANRIARRLEEKKIEVVAIHGNKSQSVRTRNLSLFLKGKKRVLVATDVASRGLDINQLPVVINYNLPHVSENYVHRIGRTGRAEETGLAISLVCAEEFPELVAIERLIQNFIPRQVAEGFEPIEELKKSPEIKAPKKKRPKKKKQKDIPAQK